MTPVFFYGSKTSLWRIEPTEADGLYVYNPFTSLQLIHYMVCFSKFGLRVTIQTQNEKKYRRKSHMYVLSTEDLECIRNIKKEIILGAVCGLLFFSAGVYVGSWIAVSCSLFMLWIAGDSYRQMNLYQKGRHPFQSRISAAPECCSFE